jgi:hypothetical protein
MLSISKLDLVVSFSAACCPGTADRTRPSATPLSTASNNSAKTSRFVEGVLLVKTEEKLVDSEALSKLLRI